jgi:formylglycine-generating enzyme required for sulfatase activity
VYEVTQQQYEKVMGSNPSYCKGPQNPVEQVSWDDAVEFCRKLSELPEEKAVGHVYRLPTEAEWEYACRAGTTTKYSCGDSDYQLGDYAWYDEFGGATHPVGGKKPNAWGLYDMHGNVGELCQDYWGDYPSGSVTDPTGAASGLLRVGRGGNRLFNSDSCSSARRYGYSPDTRNRILGFRVLRSSIVTTDKQVASIIAKTPPAKTPAEATVKKDMTPAQLALGDPVVNSVGMLLVSIPAGEFQMGSPDSDSNARGSEKPQHLVQITKPFYLGVYEVTQQQYEKVMGKNPSEFKGAENPVERVSWTDAVEFCRKLSSLPEEKAAGHVYRLPTEAEWEYACRAGTQTAYSFGDSASELGDYAWFGTSTTHTHPVGSKKPNGWGLYDMHGNVMEWSQDRHGKYPSGSTTDPTGAASGSSRVVRGGCWCLNSDYCRSAYRDRGTPDFRSDYLGFRVLRSSVR